MIFFFFVANGALIKLLFFKMCIDQAINKLTVKVTCVSQNLSYKHLPKLRKMYPEFYEHLVKIFYYWCLNLH